VIRLAVRVAADRAELVLAELLALCPAGVEEQDLPDGIVEYAVYGAPGELPTLPALDAVVGDALVEVLTRELPDDWSERWKEFHQGILLAPPPGAPVPALNVRPPWEPASDRARDALEIVIDPGQAFGTGAHATTRLCLELLLELAAELPARGSVLDVGTGSGVLAIAASLLGFAPVAAVDNELESVLAAAENARVNGASIAVSRLDIRSAPPPGLGAAELVLANLLAPLLRDLAHALASADRRPAHLIASGLLEHEADEIAELFASVAGLSLRERRDRGEWSALWLVAGAQAPSESSVAAQTFAR
jgi:ribosomal protein L11 methyltransferase